MRWYYICYVSSHLLLDHPSLLSTFILLFSSPPLTIFNYRLMVGIFGPPDTDSAQHTWKICTYECVLVGVKCLCLSICFHSPNVKVNSQLRQSSKYFNHLCNLLKQLWSQAMCLISVCRCVCMCGCVCVVVALHVWQRKVSWWSFCMPHFGKVIVSEGLWVFT